MRKSLTGDASQTVDRFQRLSTKLLGKLKEDQLTRERARERWFAEMEIITDCVSATLTAAKQRPHCAQLYCEMTSLLEEIYFLFRDSHSDLKKMFEFKDEAVSNCTIDLEKLALDLRDLVEASLEGERLKAHAIADQSEYIVSLEGKNHDLEVTLRSLEKKITQTTSEKEVLEKENYRLRKVTDQQMYDIEKLHDEVSFIPKLECKLANLHESLLCTEDQRNKLSSIRRDLEVEQGKLLAQNNDLAAEADREHAEVRRLRSREEDNRVKLLAVILN